MAKFVEMDDKVTLNDQMEIQVTGPVLAITIILVSFLYAYNARKRRVVNSNDIGSASQIRDKHQNDRDKP